MKPNQTQGQDHAREQAKARIVASGKTFAQVAIEIGYPYWMVSHVLNGTVRARSGKAHQCAVALGIKPAQAA